jgi:hypothetical protein
MISASDADSPSIWLSAERHYFLRPEVHGFGSSLDWRFSPSIASQNTTSSDILHWRQPTKRGSRIDIPRAASFWTFCHGLLDFPTNEEYQPSSCMVKNETSKGSSAAEARVVT